MMNNDKDKQRDLLRAMMDYIVSAQRFASKPKVFYVEQDMAEVLGKITVRIGVQWMKAEVADDADLIGWCMGVQVRVVPAIVRMAKRFEMASEPKEE